MNKNLIILLLLLSCNTPEKYKVIGVVKEVNLEQNRLLIEHDEIPGFMVKMVMYFNIHESVEIGDDVQICCDTIKIDKFSKIGNDVKITCKSFEDLRIPLTS